MSRSGCWTNPYQSLGSRIQACSRPALFSVVFGLFLAATPIGVEAVHQITTWGNELFPKLQAWSA